MASPTTPIRRTLPRVSALALALLLALGASAPALAEAQDDGTVTWSVRPADASGEDGRAWVEQELDPGASATEHLAIRNFSEQEVTFRITTADAYFQENGRFSMLPSTEESVDAGTWIDVVDEVVVGAGEVEIVPFTTTVPENATPGDHAAGIAASILSQQVGEDGSSVGVESRVGFRVMTRVAGELTPSASVEAVSSEYDVSWNPLAPGDAVVRFEVVNSGNTRLMVTGTAAAGGRQSAFPGPDEIDQELLPGDRRTFTVPVDDVWPLFSVPVELEVVPTVVGEGEGTPVDAVRVETGMWAIPWSQLAVLAGIALIVGSGVWGRRRSRRRIERLLAQAREEGRREAAAPTGD
ncbi:WxL protein peptidoglycan domain-containing protein [Microbacterium sp. JZ101]